MGCKKGKDNRSNYSPLFPQWTPDQNHYLFGLLFKLKDLESFKEQYFWTTAFMLNLLTIKLDFIFLKQEFLKMSM